jgi:hypothetical protein
MESHVKATWLAADGWGGVDATATEDAAPAADKILEALADGRRAAADELADAALIVMGTVVLVWDITFWNTTFTNFDLNINIGKIIHGLIMVYPSLHCKIQRPGSQG